MFRRIVLNYEHFVLLNEYQIIKYIKQVEQYTKDATPFHLLINILSSSLRYLDELLSVSERGIIGPVCVCMVFSLRSILFNYGSTGKEKSTQTMSFIIFYCLCTQASLFAGCFVSGYYLATTVLAAELLYSYDVRVKLELRLFLPNNLTLFHPWVSGTEF